MGYFAELARNWRPLVAAALGMGAGLSLNAYMGGIFAPHLIREFGWSRSDYALVGATGLLILLVLPLYGRMVDLIGVRRTAAIGVIGYPAAFVAFSQMTGDFRVFLLITSLQTLLGGATTAAVYSRIVAQSFRQARGLALGIAACGPPLVGAAVSMPLTGFILEHGWRAGYQAAALGSLLLGVTALLLMPRSIVNSEARAHPGRATRRDYGRIARSPAFWVIILGMILCNLAHPITATQLNLVLMDSNASVSTAAMLITLFGGGVAAGRLICGIALDRLPTHLVAAVVMATPGLGMFLLASPLDSTPVLGFAMLLTGTAVGAESDVIAYLVVRIFGIDIYGTVFGLVSATVGLTSASGAILLSVMLRGGGGFAPFLTLNGVLILVGGALFLLLGRYRQRAETPAPPAKEIAVA